MAKIDVEITSKRENGDWTWRAVGARQPKGTINASLLPTESAVGSQFSVETEHYLDGIVVTKVFDKKQTSGKGETLEILGSGKENDLVTTKLAKNKKNKKFSKDSPSSNSRRNERSGDKKSFVKKDKPVSNSNKKVRNAGGRKPQNGKKQQSANQFPKSKRLKAKRHHRNEALKQLPDEMKRIAEILVQKGLPGLRDSIDAQNEIAKKAGETEIPNDLLLKLAEQI